MGANDKLLRLLKKGDPQPFNKACAELEDEGLSLTEATLENLTLAGFDLSRFDLSATEWRDCTFAGAMLVGVDLSNSYLVGCALVDAELSESDLSGAALEGCVLRNVKIEECNLEGLELENTQILESHFRGGAWVDVAWSGVTMSGGSIRDVGEATGEFVGVKLRTVRLENLALGDVSVRGSSIRECEVVDSELPAGLKRSSGRRRTV
jgi:uncharacterized protein YjbI with pentapeptide repeats